MGFKPRTNPELGTGDSHPTSTPQIENVIDREWISVLNNLEVALYPGPRAAEQGELRGL